MATTPKRATGPGGGRQVMRPVPTPAPKRDPKIWEQYKTQQGYTKWRKKKKPPRSGIVPPSVLEKEKRGGPRTSSVKKIPKQPKYTQPKLGPPAGPRPLQPRRKPRKKGSIS